MIIHIFPQIHVFVNISVKKMRKISLTLKSHNDVNNNHAILGQY